MEIKSCDYEARRERVFELVAAFMNDCFLFVGSRVKMTSFLFGCVLISQAEQSKRFDYHISGDFGLLRRHVPIILLSLAATRAFMHAEKRGE